MRIERGEQHGSADMLRGDFTSFAHNCVFAVGMDATDPGFPGGSARLFSGDDEYFTSVTPSFAAADLADLGDVFERAKERLGAVAKAPQTRSGEWRIASRYAQNAPEREMSPDSMRLQTGLLATGDRFSAVLACGVENDRAFPIVHLFFRPEGGEEWTQVDRFHAHWMPHKARTLGEVLDAVPAPSTGMRR